MRAGREKATLPVCRAGTAIGRRREGVDGFCQDVAWDVNVEGFATGGVSLVRHTFPFAASLKLYLEIWMILYMKDDSPRPLPHPPGRVLAYVTPPEVRTGVWRGKRPSLCHGHKALRYAQ